MAISASLTLTTPKLNFHSWDCHAKPTPSSKTLLRCLCSNDKESQKTTSTKTKKAVREMGVVVLGALAATVVAISPMEAEATRIEYYATVGEPLCDLTFVRSGLGFCDIQPGSGQEAPYNELINVHYTARFADGTVFDSSYKRGRPLTMRIGAGKILRGLDQGILGGDGVPPMLVGGKRKLKLPPHLAYGPEPAGCFSGDCNIPGNATLLYDINFVGVYSGNRK